MPKQLLLLDHHNILFRGMYSLPYLSHDEKYTAGLLGYIMQLSAYINTWKPTHCAVVTDARPYKRQLLYPEYKSNREKKKDPNDPTFQRFSESRIYCEDFLKRIELPLIKVQGYEADDIMAHFIQKLHDRFENIILVTNDSDMVQMLKFDNVILEKGKRGKYTITDFNRDYDCLTPESWWKIGAIAGTHNAVPQLIPKVREKTAMKIIRDQNRWDSIYSDYKEKIDLHRKLIELPFDDEIPEDILQLHKPDFRVNNIIGFLERVYNFQMRMSIELALQHLSASTNVVGI